ncbi:DNA polymerase IV [Alteromonadales bacterium alter-6D02]|nr:DNA polymerase IV [Alteromonadales bacterium alter-6D02]
MRKIIHVDMDCFFAAVEMRDNPILASLPIAIGGASDRRGVIATCNYIAREYGVRSAMATSLALKLCPHLQLVPGRMGAYKEASAQVFEIFKRYSSLVESLSLDEAYIDVSDCQLFSGSATLIAQQIRQDILDETGLTASAGIAPNKFMAKIASDLNKPNGQFVITPDQVDEFAFNLPLNKIPGVGKVTFGKLQQLGLMTGEDIRATELPWLEQRFGKMAHVLKQRSLGIDPSTVNPHRERKSVGVETTLAADINGQASCWPIVEQLYQELHRRLVKVEKGKIIAKQGIKIKFNDFKSTTVEKSVDDISLELCRQLLEQALERSYGRSVRLIGLSVGFTAPKADDVPQLDLFD